MRSFVHQLIDAIVHWCTRETKHRMGLGASHAAGGQVDSPATTPHPAASRGDLLPTAQSSVGVLAAPSSSPIPTCGEQEVAQEDTEEAVPRSLHVQLGQQTLTWSAPASPEGGDSSSKDPSQPPMKAPHHQ